jgi:hypothetical protein
MASSPSVGRGGLGGMIKLLTKCFVNVNENFRHLMRPVDAAGLDERADAGTRAALPP